MLAEISSEVIGLGSAVGALTTAVVWLTKMLLKEKDSKLQMLMEIYEAKKREEDK